ncbi:bifunctional diaminohydroxyphosphoribosylaminopyrimidine deaminase/5-amino-6-(5-phosphoribosylamino)uracil reductase RibD [Gilvibacter sp.]|uniref:bifunctional diaminohydroxyphosphoribosylaminopyrimidine deaminase/5-amino-6-(5-phosphoribosylamino)uracil reductase RibD n=1 Tax=Gilvibacter sp. TaxID=2729997 RepID=UPI0035BE5748
MSPTTAFSPTEYNTHQAYMKRCLSLAALGLGTTDPNPMVGCVIVQDKTIIGEGWHQKAGEAHAEVQAVNSVKDKALLKGSTVYVSLEPCSHFGKTPPCADLLIREQVGRVIIGCTDPNPEVAGSGIKKLEAAGIEVIRGVCEQEARALNKRFFTFHNKRRPFVILKWAQSNDGYIAPAQKTQQAPVWISNALSRQRTHKWRAEESAILIGVETALSDDPSLTTRDWPGKSPIRIVIDINGRLDEKLKVLDGSVPTIVFTAAEKTTTANHIDYIKVAAGELPINDLLRDLFDKGVQSLIVEGGASTLQRFIDSGLWDEARTFISPTDLKSGLEAPVLDLEPSSAESLHHDRLLTYLNPQQL